MFRTQLIIHFQFIAGINQSPRCDAGRKTYECMMYQARLLHNKLWFILKECYFMQHIRYISVHHCTLGSTCAWDTWQCYTHSSMGELIALIFAKDSTMNFSSTTYMIVKSLELIALIFAKDSTMNFSSTTYMIVQSLEFQYKRCNANLIYRGMIMISQNTSLVPIILLQNVWTLVWHFLAMMSINDTQRLYNARDMGISICF